MTEPLSELPLSPDHHAESVFPEWQRMTPEEYAARNGHLWVSFSFDNYRYANQKLQWWVHRLGQLLNDRAELDRLRRNLLTPAERKRVARERELEW